MRKVSAGLSLSVFGCCVSTKYYIIYIRQLQLTRGANIYEISLWSTKDSLSFKVSSVYFIFLYNIIFDLPADPLSALFLWVLNEIDNYNYNIGLFLLYPSVVRIISNNMQQWSPILSPPWSRLCYTKVCDVQTPQCAAWSPSCLASVSAIKLIFLVSYPQTHRIWRSTGSSIKQRSPRCVF